MGVGKTSGGNQKNTGADGSSDRADGRLISMRYFYFSDKNDFKKLSAAPKSQVNQTLVNVKMHLLAHSVRLVDRII